jgi:hypothetical protein
VPSSDYDLQGHLKAIGVPTVYHEVGQWAVYPDYTEITKYTGVLKPSVLEACRAQAVENGIIDLAPAFHLASGRFAWALWKDDIETALRTEDMAGFQMLQLHDVPGLGEVLVGMLDVFRDSKGIMTQEQFRRFCSETVPLLRLPKFVWSADEPFAATALVAHHGMQPLENAVVEWRLRNKAGEERAAGTFPATTIRAGLTNIGAVQLPLGFVEKPEQFTLELGVQHSVAANQWNIWVFPPFVKPAPAPDVTVCRTWADALPALHEGKRVVLTLDPASQSPNTLPSRFLPVTKTIRIFGQQPPTMGLLCDPAHPALENFPTEFHADMQWWEILRAPSLSFELTSLPITPIVHAIDDFHSNRKLAYVFEAKVGRGMLLACSLDLLDPERQGPVAHYFLQGLIDYAQSRAFKPSVELPESFGSGKVASAVQAAP